MPAPDRPTLICLHYLGGSAREWAAVADALRGVARCVPVDLPGFGDAAAAATGYGVDAMADAVARAVRADACVQWALVGHSMGAKVAAVVARRAEDGAEGLSGLTHIVTLAGSPPGPEPMEEARRASMRGWFTGDAAESAEQARGYVAANVVELRSEVRAAAEADVLQANPDAWRAWLDAGSREDVSARVGILRTPALIVAGEADADLGPEAQRALMAPHFSHARLATVPGAKHLLPLEQPGAVARLIADHLG